MLLTLDISTSFLNTHLTVNDISNLDANNNGIVYFDVSLNNGILEKNEIYNDFYSNGNNFALEKLLGKKNSVIKI